MSPAAKSASIGVKNAIVGATSSNDACAGGDHAPAGPATTAAAARTASPAASLVAVTTTGRRLRASSSVPNRPNLVARGPPPEEETEERVAGRRLGERAGVRQQRGDAAPATRRVSRVDDVRERIEAEVLRQCERERDPARVPPRPPLQLVEREPERRAVGRGQRVPGERP